MKIKESISLGVIISNRDFFPDKLVKEARKDVLSLTKKLEIKVVLLSEADSKFGGILIVLTNFEDGREVAQTLKLSELNVPFLIIATNPDDLEKLDVFNRRDAWCGKLSVCHNLYQFEIKFSLTEKHVGLQSLYFISDLEGFMGVCKVVNSLSHVRIEAFGARPAPFHMMWNSEKILQRNRILESIHHSIHDFAVLRTINKRTRIGKNRKSIEYQSKILISSLRAPPIY